MSSVDLIEFLLTGQLGKIEVGSSQSDVRAWLGEPDDVGGFSRKKRRPSVYKHGDIEIGFDDEQATKIALATDEALVNVIKHGYGGTTGKPIEIRFEQVEKDGQPGLRILITDEARKVDPNQIRGVRKTMRRLSETETILLSTHILQEVEAMADRVILINEGRLVFDGDVHGLRQKGNDDLDEAFHALTREDAMAS